MPSSSIYSSTTAILLFSVSVSATATDPCSKTSQQGLCRSIASSYNFSAPLDIEIAVIKNAMTEISATISKTDHLISAAANKTYDDQLLVQRLYSCRDYESSNRELDVALKYLTEKGQVFNLLDNIFTVTKYVVTCEDEWKDSGLLKDFPLEDITNNLKDLLRIIFDLGKNLKFPNGN